MASHTLTDSAVIERLGGIAVVARALGKTDHAVKKWTQRGIPWKYRPQVKKLAAEQRKTVPANFIEVRAA